MKSILKSIILSWTLSVAIISCNNDKDPVAVNPLVGTWVMERIEITGCTDNDENGEYTLGCTADNCSKVTVAANNAFISTITLLGVTETDTGTYLIMGNDVEICANGGTECSTSEFILLENNQKVRFTEVHGSSGCITKAWYKRI